MDHVKKIFRIIYAQRFWVICVIVMILPLAGWFATTASMHAKTEERKKEIVSTFKEAETLRNKQDPPNDTSHAEMEKEIAALRQRVGKAWESQYAKQIDLLVWPQELSDDFRNAVKQYNPIEKVKFPTPPNEEMYVRLRDHYRDYIKAELPKLAKIIDAQWWLREGMSMAGGMGGDSGSGSGSGSGGSGFGGFGSSFGGSSGGPSDGSSTFGGPPLQIVDNSKVRWNPSDQAMLWNRYDWSMRNAEKTPRTLDLLYAQEDLWVMTALLQIIAETNKGSSARYNAVVKDIQSIQLGGTRVRGSSGKVSGARGGAFSSGDGSGEMEMMMSGGASFIGGSGGSGGADGADAMMMTRSNTDPADKRYVDLNYEPIPADVLRKAIETDSQSPDQAYMLVAKRIPIRLRLTIDQRKLNHLIAACGNSKLMVEIRQVRFNYMVPKGLGGGSATLGPGGFSSGGDSGGSSGSSFGGSGGFGSSGSSGGSSGSSGSGGSGGSMDGGFNQNSSGMADFSPHDKPVELFGIVYIYNPVDVKKLKLEEGAAPAAPPAAPAKPASEVGG